MTIWQVAVPASGEFPVPTFAVGDRVRLKARRLGPNVDPALWTGTVVNVPDPKRALVILGGHRLGDEVTVDLDSGGRGVAETSHWEAI